MEGLGCCSNLCSTSVIEPVFVAGTKSRQTSTSNLIECVNHTEQVVVRLKDQWILCAPAAKESLSKFHSDLLFCPTEYEEQLLIEVQDLDVASEEWRYVQELHVDMILERLNQEPVTVAIHNLGISKLLFFLDHLHGETVQKCDLDDLGPCSKLSSFKDVQLLCQPIIDDMTTTAGDCVRLPSGDLAIPSSTTIGSFWSHFEQQYLKESSTGCQTLTTTFNESRPTRPIGPTFFRGDRSCGTQMTSSSTASLLEDKLAVVHSSTSHEIMWSQLEEELRPTLTCNPDRMTSLKQVDSTFSQSTNLTHFDQPDECSSVSKPNSLKAFKDFCFLKDSTNGSLIHGSTVKDELDEDHSKDQDSSVSFQSSSKKSHSIHGTLINFNESLQSSLSECSKVVFVGPDRNCIQYIRTRTCGLLDEDSRETSVAMVPYFLIKGPIGGYAMTIVQKYNRSVPVESFTELMKENVTTKVVKLNLPKDYCSTFFRRLPPIRFGDVLESQQVPSFTPEPTHKLKRERYDSVYALDLNRIGLDGVRCPSGVPSPYCVYAEVSAQRNIQGVTAPNCMSPMESKSMRSLLDRKLKCAVASLFFDNTIKPNMFHSSSLSDSPDGNIEVTSEPVNSDRSLTDCHEKRSMLSRDSGTSWTLHSRNSYAGGLHMFSYGPRFVRPPRYWMEFVSRPATQGAPHKCVRAWKVEQSNFYVGGLINYDVHLHLITSSNDGRLGFLRQQISPLLAEMLQRRMRFEQPQDSMDKSIGGIHIRAHLHSPNIAHMMAFISGDMSAAFGLSNLNIGVVSFPLTQDYCTSKWNSEKIVIYSKERLTLSDQQQWDHLQEGVKRLLILERELSKSIKSYKVKVMPVERLSFLLERVRRQYSDFASSLLIHSIGGNQEQLGERITQYNGTLAQCVRGMAYFPGHTFPMATDPDAYHAYKQVFDSFLLTLNRLNNLPTAVAPMPCYKLPVQHRRIRSNLPNILSYRICFSRNLLGYGFSMVLNKIDYHTIEQLCKDALFGWSLGNQCKCYPLASFALQNPELYTDLDRKGLHMTNQDMVKRACGFYRHWPDARSIFVTPKYSTCDLVVHINGDDHLRIVSADWSGRNPYTAYLRAVKMMRWLDSALPFSRSRQWGFLSPSPRNVGTGMELSALVKLPFLGRNREKLAQFCTRLRLQLCNADVPKASSLTGLFEIRLNSSVGMTESESFVAFLSSVWRICETELHSVQ